ncbi:MAG: DUF1292 domain-containing protein [Oscillospiraceae bacterium]|nr:DUF1292 domain-containing protein [Oscillospiraceae bacterium]
MDNDSGCKNEEEGVEFLADLITLTDEDGEEHTFELVDTLERNSQSYVALIPDSEDPEDALQDDGSLVIMKIVEEDGEEILELIEDDEEFEDISNIFMDRLSDLFEFDDFEDEEDE